MICVVASSSSPEQIALLTHAQAAAAVHHVASVDADPVALIASEGWVGQVWHLIMVQWDEKSVVLYLVPVH